MKNTKLISVIIPTLNRPDNVTDTVHSLLKQSYKNYEIIILDQSDVPLGSTARNTFYKKKIKYFHIKEKGLPNARNIGIIKSRGDIILFLDDDIVPDNDLLLYHYRGFKRKDIGCISGRVIEQDSLKKSSVVGSKVALSGRVLRNFDVPLRQPTLAALGANMSFLREAVEKTGFFDVKFIGNAQLEETDYCYRLRKAGYRIIFEPKACLTHLRLTHGGCRNREPFQEIFDRFHNTVLFYCKNMRKILLPYVFLVHGLIGVKKVLFPSRDIRKFFWVLKALVEGLKSYMQSPSGNECSTGKVNK
jgi:GT2 family glycosyltransferase